VTICRSDQHGSLATSLIASSTAGPTFGSQTAEAPRDREVRALVIGEVDLALPQRYKRHLVIRPAWPDNRVERVLGEGSADGAKHGLSPAYWLSGMTASTR
jgi:hypothetical protein